MTIKQWARELGMEYDVLWNRLRRVGLSMEEALKKPVQRRKVV